MNIHIYVILHYTSIDNPGTGISELKEMCNLTLRNIANLLSNSYTPNSHVLCKTDVSWATS